MSLLAQVVRNGVVEAEHHGVVAVVAPDGSLVAGSGDVDRLFYGRSALKPFQARASLDGGAKLAGSALAVACSSYGGLPIHVAYTRQMLHAVGLTEDDLQTPPTWPMSEAQGRRYFAQGQMQPQAVWHGCSGKHAGMLQACVASGWPTESYLDPRHPFEVLVRRRLAEAVGHDLGDPGVDGCGVPVFEVSARSLARGFAHLASHADYELIWAAMHRYAALVGENPRIDQLAATVSESAAKIGAEGLIGVAVRDRFGIVVKSWDGSTRAIEAGLIGTMEQLGLLNGSSRQLLSDRLAVSGGDRVQGRVEPMVSLT